MKILLCKRPYAKRRESEVASPEGGYIPRTVNRMHWISVKLQGANVWFDILFTMFFQPFKFYVSCRESEVRRSGLDGFSDNIALGVVCRLMPMPACNRL